MPLRDLVRRALRLRLCVAQFVKNLAAQYAFQGGQGARDRRAVEHPMIVRQANVDRAIGVERAVVQGRGQRRKDMQPGRPLRSRGTDGERCRRSAAR